MPRSTSTCARRWLLRASFALLIAYILIFTIGYTLEYRVELGALRWLTGTRIVLFALACGYLWSASGRRQLVDPFALCLILVIVTGAVSGLFVEKEWLTYVRHAFQYGFLLSFYLLGRELGRCPIPAIAVGLISAAVLVGYATAVGLYVATPGLQSGSYSFQPNLALLPVAFGLWCGNWLMTAAGCIIVVVGNKRAVYIGLAVMIAIYLALRLAARWRIGVVGRVVFVGITAPAIGAVLGLAVSLLTSSMSSFMPSSLPTVLDRFTVKPTFNGGIMATPKQEATVDPLVRLTSARSVEVYTVWNMVRRSPAEVLFGHGFGSQFTVRYISPNNYEPVQFDRVQADLEPVQIAMTSGLPLAFIFTVMLCGMVAMFFVRIGTADGADLPLALFTIGSMLDTLLGFHATNPVCWAALGIVSCRLLPDFSIASASWFRRTRAVQENV